MKHPQELDIHDWQSLSEFETFRVACSHWKCDGKKDAFTITRTIDGCVYNCYRCGTSGAIFMGSSPQMAQQKLKDIRNDRKNKSDTLYNNVVLPNDFVHMITHDKSIPSSAYAWLYQYELTDTDIYTYNIGYAYRLQRVIIPIYDTIRLGSGDKGYKLIGWQGRDVFYNRNQQLYTKGILKRPPMRYYIEVDSNKYNNNNIKIKYNNKIYYKIISKSIKKDKLIIVEDILSCIKCYNKYKVDVIALLNSTISNQLITMLHGYSKVFIWLDFDARVKAIKTSHQCQNQGINTTTIRTKEDPKSVPYKDMLPLC